MILRFFTICLIVLISGCASNAPLKNNSLEQLSAVQLCDHLMLSSKGSSPYSKSVLLANLKSRGIPISECKNVGFSKYIQENPLPTSIPYTHQSSRNAISSELRNEISELKSQLGQIKTDSIIQKNQAPQETIQEWRERRDKRLRFRN